MKNPFPQRSYDENEKYFCYHCLVITVLVVIDQRNGSDLREWGRREEGGCF
jgi:hypothetical protein